MIWKSASAAKGQKKDVLMSEMQDRLGEAEEALRAALADVDGMKALLAASRSYVSALSAELSGVWSQADAEADRATHLLAAFQEQQDQLVRIEAALREKERILQETWQHPWRSALDLVLGKSPAVDREPEPAAIKLETPESLRPTRDRGDRHGPDSPEYQVLESSGLFDADYYRARNKDVEDARADPLEHYLNWGWLEDRDPNPFFKSNWYIEKNTSISLCEINPLLHYIIVGEAEGRAPGPQFDPAWYREEYGHAFAGETSPLAYYLRHGAAQGHLPSRKQAAGLDEVVSYLPAPMKAFFRPLEPYEAWLSVNAFSSAAEAELRSLLDQRRGRLPRISLVTPVYNTPEPLLRELVASVLGQVYDDWELCLADDASPSPHVRPLLRELAALDRRIKVKTLDTNGGISTATNAAVEMATGDIIAFLDHDDLITPDCLAEFAIYYADNPESDIVYSDDDKIDLNGRRFAPQFKPDWSPALLLSFMYISHMFTVRRELFINTGGFRSEFDGSQDYDFALRASERARHIGHVPRILYHWRVVPGSTAESGDAKPASFEAGRLAVEQAMERRGVASKVVHPAWALEARVGMFAIDYPDTGPQVTIIIPTYNQLNYLRRCVESLAKTTYRNFDVLVVDNESDDPETLDYLAELDKQPGRRVVRIRKQNGKFSFAALMNEAVTHASSDFILLLNNDTEVVAPRWLSQMMGLAQMDGVGSVGARLYFADRTIQHAGIVHGYHEGLVGHAFRNAPPHNWGYMGFLRTSREYSAVTAACVLTPRDLFNRLGGFDAKNFAIAYNDVDFGYRLVGAGYRNIYCADAELFHFEGKTRPKKDDPREVIALRRIYGKWRDSWYNPNLSLENEQFEPAAIRLANRNEKPLRVVFVSHNLNFEGAPNTLLDLAIGLVKEGIVDATVLSPGDGPLRAAYEAAGIRVRLFTAPPVGDSADGFLEGCRELADLFRELGAEVVVANTLPMFFATSAASMAGLPAIWCQHESEPWQSYFNYVAPEVRGYAYAAFAQAYRVTYVAEATRRAWSELQTRRNFQIIRHGIPPERLEAELGLWTRDEARAALGVAENEFAIVVVGTVCARKGQLDLIDAFASLPASHQARARVFIAGAFGEADYRGRIERRLGDLPPSVAARIRVTGPVEETARFYAAADLFVCTSRIESAPRVIVEAMAFGLPIVTTPVFGIPEIVDQDVNALFYGPGDVASLASNIAHLMDDSERIAALGGRSAQVLQSKPGYREMIANYGEIIREASMVAVGAS